MKLNIFLALALVSCVAYGLFVRSNPSQPNVEVLPEMVRTAAYRAYSGNSNFADGKTLQEPPPDTIPRGFRRVAMAVSEEGAIRARLGVEQSFQDRGSRGSHARRIRLSYLVSALSRSRWPRRWTGRHARFSRASAVQQREGAGAEGRTDIPHPDIRSEGHAALCFSGV